MATKKTTVKGAKAASKAKGAKASKTAKAQVINHSTKSEKTKKSKVEPVVSGPHLVDLITITKMELRPLDVVHGTYYMSGENSGTFKQAGIEPQNTRPWECRIKLAEEKPYARISANCNGGFLNVYVPKENFKTNGEFLEILLDQTELLVEKMDGIDTVAIIDKLDALKREILEAA